MNRANIAAKTDDHEPWNPTHRNLEITSRTPSTTRNQTGRKSTSHKQVMMHTLHIALHI